MKENEKKGVVAKSPKFSQNATKMSTIADKKPTASAADLLESSQVESKDIDSKLDRL